MGNNAKWSIVWEITILLMSGAVLWGILCHFLIDSSESFKTNVQKKCVGSTNKNKVVVAPQSNEIVGTCCWEPEAILPYMVQYVKSNKVNILLIIIFWFVGIIFTKTSDKMVKRMI